MTSSTSWSGKSFVQKTGRKAGRACHLTSGTGRRPRRTSGGCFYDKPRRSIATAVDPSLANLSARRGNGRAWQDRVPNGRWESPFVGDFRRYGTGSTNHTRATWVSEGRLRKVCS